MFFSVSDCPYENLKGNGYCDGVANNNECEYDGGDCCLKEACKIKKIRKCDDGKDCTTKTEMDTCKDSTCECLDPDIRKYP